MRAEELRTSGEGDVRNYSGCVLCDYGDLQSHVLRLDAKISRSAANLVSNRERQITIRRADANKIAINLISKNNYTL